MPTISMFYGIIISMFLDSDGKYQVPHIHAYYSDYKAVIGLDESILEGSMSENKMRLILAWVVIHRESLLANWQILLGSEPCFQIDPLR